MKVKELFETEERSVLSVMGKQEDTYFGTFDIPRQRLTSLVGSPNHVTGNYDCDFNELTSLEGGPTVVAGGFFCSHNKLTSLEGAPNNIGLSLFCDGNGLTSLRGIHKQIQYIGRVARFSASPIKSHVLGLLKIRGLQGVVLSNLKVQAIINKHLEGDRDIFACQEELIEAGYPEFAQL